MLINKAVTSEQAHIVADYTENKKSKVEAKKNTDTSKSETPAAVLELSETKAKEVTYKKPGSTPVDRKAIDKMIEDSNHKMEQFKNLIRTLIEKQGGTVEAALTGKFEVKIDEATRLEAQEAISEDGEFGVAKTAERIVSFAKAISGGDVSKLETLKKAIKQGFDEAERILGELPEVSKQTYTEIMKQLDQWAKGGESVDE